MKSIMAFLSLLILFVLTSCSDNDRDYPLPYETTAMVSVIANESSGLTLEQYVSRSQTRILSAAHIDSKYFTPGRRLLVRYRAELADTSANPVPVRLTGYRIIQFDTVRPMPHDRIITRQPAGVDITSQWITGDFLNFQCRVLFDGSMRGYTLVADESTLDNSEVECYFVAGRAAVPDSSVYRRDFASFYLGELQISSSQRIVIGN